MKKKIFLSLEERKNLFDMLSEGQAGDVKGGYNPPPRPVVTPSYVFPPQPPQPPIPPVTVKFKPWVTTIGYNF